MSGSGSRGRRGGRGRGAPLGAAAAARGVPATRGVPRFRGVSAARGVLVLCAVVGAMAGCGGPDGLAGRTPDVLLVSVDTTRGDRWGCTGDPDARTPEVDRLARRGLLAFEGRAPTPITLPSHTSMLTGVPPAVHGVRDNGIFHLAPDAGLTVPEVLRDAGWATGALVSAFPLSARFGLSRGFDHYDAFLGAGGASEHLRERRAEETVARAERWLTGDKAPPAERPLFAWVHFFDPHAPYAAPGVWSSLPVDAYRAEIAYADRQLRRLQRTFSAHRARPRAVIVVSDHGEGLGEHGESSHGVLVHLATIRIPIVVAAPGDTARLRAEPVPLESVAATVLRLAGVDGALAPEAVPAVEDFDAAIVSESLYPWFNYRWRGQRAIEEGGWRLTVGPDEWLYAVPPDVGERTDLAAAEPRRTRELRDELEFRMERYGERAWSSAEREMTSEDIEALSALGYAASPMSMVSDSGFVAGPDPRERLADLDELNLAITAYDRGDVVSARTRLEGLVRRDPENRAAWEYLGRAALDAGEAVTARDALQRALGLGRNPVQVWMLLADAEAQLGNPAAALEALEGALVSDPASAQLRVRVGQELARANRHEEALEHLREAVRLRPRSVPAQLGTAQLLERVGRPDEARPHWERVLELEPRGPAAQAARAALARTGGG